jgi:hypothetical protein
LIPMTRIRIFIIPRHKRDAENHELLPLWATASKAGYTG